MPILACAFKACMEPGQDGSRYSYPLTGAKIGVVGLLIQTRSPPSQQALRPSCSPIPPRQIPHLQPPASEWRVPHDPSSTNERWSGLVAAELKQIIKRSVFGLIRVYNDLPQFVVSAKTAKVLQRRLQKRAKVAAVSHDINWPLMFHAS